MHRVFFFYLTEGKSRSIISKCNIFLFFLPSKHPYVFYMVFNLPGEMLHEFSVNTGLCRMMHGSAALTAKDKQQADQNKVSSSSVRLQSPDRWHQLWIPHVKVALVSRKRAHCQSHQLL